MEFVDVIRLLRSKELEDLLVAANSGLEQRPFVVENVRVVGNKKEIDIRYMATNNRRMVEVGDVAGTSTKEVDDS